MPSPTPKRRQQPPQPAPELIDPSFLLKGLGVVFTVALILAYITLCVVYSRSQWQLVLHPSRAITTTPASFGLNFTEVHFGVDISGEPQLDGWWIPAETPASPTALVLHDGTGSMSDALPSAVALHNAHLNVLLFDYRGFGHSGGDHPSQSLMQTDAEAAMNYITSTNHAYPGGLAVFGMGLGGSLATKLAQNHNGVNALILEDPEGDMRNLAAGDIRSHFVPTSVLFHEDFPLAAPLATLGTPKLLIAHSASSTPALFKQAASPKMTVELTNSKAADLEEAIARFRDSYLH